MGRTTEQLGDEITSLAAHIQAATCRWLGLVAEFDQRGGWGEWGMASCAHWLAWRCSLSPGVAREHVRVANRLQELALVREAFSRGELSYSKVRALTRMHDVAREAELLELARHATAAQLDRIVAAYRRVLAAEDAERIHEERFLRVSPNEDGSVSIRGRLPAEAGALLQKALEAMNDRLYAEGEDVPAGASAADRAARNADALAAIADAALAAPDAARTGGDRYQVVVHVDEDALAGRAEPQRSELDDGAPIAPETARRLACDAGIVPLLERNGRPLSVGRKTRSVPPALRRALRSRDHGCRFPGCTRRRGVDAHHVEHWANGGETSLGNLVQLCRHHHRLVHEGGYRVERRRGDFAFRRPDGRLLHPVPRPRRGDPQCVTDENRRLHVSITPQTVVPLWMGEPLHLGDAVEALLKYAPPDGSPEAREPPASSGT